MPLTAERMRQVIDIASQAVEKSEAAKRGLDSISNDIGSIRSRLNEKAINDEVLDELVWSIGRLAQDTRLLCDIPAQLIQNLGAEQTWFNMNQSKHKKQAQRMRNIRADKPKGSTTRTKDESEPGPETKLPKIFGKLDVAAIMRQDVEDNKRIGQERHPEQGPCNSDADGQCSWCGQASVASVPNSQMDEPDFQHEQWLPKQYKEQDA